MRMRSCNVNITSHKWQIEGNLLLSFFIFFLDFLVCFKLKSSINLFSFPVVIMEAVKQFDRIVLSSDVIVPIERLLNTPSQKDGMSHDLEVDLRVTGCDYIQSAGLLLKLPQVWVGLVRGIVLTTWRPFLFFRSPWRRHRFFFIVFIIRGHLSSSNVT